MIAVDGVTEQDDDQELACTITDLLDERRGMVWTDYLHAVGAPLAEADALWRELSAADSRWMHRVCWVSVRCALLDAGAPGHPERIDR